MQIGLPVEELEKIKPIIEASGQFEGIEDSTVEKSEGYYVAILVASYREDKRVFTMSFNEADEIAGLDVK